MIPSPVLSLATRVLRSRITWGLGVALGVFVAVWANGALKYRQGVAAGELAAQLRADSVRAIVEIERDSVALQLRVTRGLLTDSLHVLELRVARADERLAQARRTYARTLSRLDSALAADTTPSPLRSACTEFRSACELAKREADSTIAAQREQIETQETKIATQDSTIAGEPDRTATAVTRGIQRDRAMRQEPSRTKWVLIGAGAMKVVDVILKAVAR